MHPLDLARRIRRTLRPTPDPDEIRAPGLAAALRRHPGLKKHAAVGAIALGAMLFAVASAATPLAGADADRAHARPAPFAASHPLIDWSQLAPPVRTNVKTTSEHKTRIASKAKPAPVTAAAISALAGNGIPTVALNAYRVAAARVDHDEPVCGIDWALLAGIGREESDHGRFAGAVLHADGLSTPRIIGIPLNGHGTALIRDTDHGRLDGDTVYDRAVGPMQFIPSTWAEYGVDGSGDGIADPFNINDAALTAARYLCAAGGNLRTHDGQVAAVLTYNDSDQYLAQVLALADAYRRGIPITGIPVGDTTGALPPVRSGTPPPANPGAPTANGSAPAQPGGTRSSTAAPQPAPAPAPSSGSSGTGSGGLPPPSGGTSSSPVPVPSPVPTPTKKCVLYSLTDPTKCILYG